MVVDFLIQKGVIALIPIGETFFHCTDFTSEKKLSYESVLFNYQKLSPYTESQVSYIQKEGKLLLWFYEKKNNTLLTLPEGYLYYKFFAKTYTDAIICIEEKLIMVIEGGVPCYQSLLYGPYDDEVAILRKKYAIHDVVEKSKYWYEKNYKKILNQPIFPLLKHFVDKQRLFENTKEMLSRSILPIGVLLIVMTAVHFGINQYLTKELDKVSQQKQETKLQTKEMFAKIIDNNKNIVFFENFFDKYDQTYIDTVLSELGEIMKKNSVELYYLKFDRKFINVRFYSEKIEAFLEDLSTVQSIESFKLIRQLKKKEGQKDITIEIVLQQGKVAHE